MNVRRYFAANMRAALDQVRHAQGSDVLILSDRKVDGGIELITATGEIEQSVLERLKATATTPQTENALPVRDAEPDPAELWTRPDTVGLMHRELGALKSLLETQLASFAWHDFQHRHPLRARLMRALARLGVAPQMGRTLVAEVSATTDFAKAWSEVLHAMHRRLNCLDDPLARDGIFALCGATGVGKTSLVAKLAARFALQHGAEHVVVISADEQRLGAHQQIRTFGRLVGIQIEAARTADELGALLGGLNDKRLILIDLPGHVPEHPQLERQIADLQAVPHPIKFLLAAAATTDYYAQMRIARALSALPLFACCVTKLDETAALGPALSLLLESGLPLAYITAGQQVPDDLESISSPDFLRRVLAFGRQHPVALQVLPFEEAFAT
ncbi:MAG: flagellar biosynthesis protein FlhF [Gammaproteobacteria bacterium]